MHVLLFYRNPQAHGGGKYSHVGLGVNALHTARMLERVGVSAEAHGVWTAAHVAAALQAARPDATHAVIEAGWIPGEQMHDLVARFPRVQFAVRNHSQIGFLQVEAGAIRIFRDVQALSESTLNLVYASNSQRYADYCERTYHSRCVYLPNLYDAQRVATKTARVHDHRGLRVSSFGALRLLKNHTTAAAAAQLIARQRGCYLEFYVSVNREEHGAGILHALREMFAGLKWARLVEVPWEPWPQFRQTVAHMDLCLQVSCTETFNITTADAVAENVPCVVSSAIEWMPAHFQAEIDDPSSIARVGNMLLSDPHATADATRALAAYNERGTTLWWNWLHASQRP